MPGRLAPSACVPDHWRMKLTRMLVVLLVVLAVLDLWSALELVRLAGLAQARLDGGWSLESARRLYVRRTVVGAAHLGAFVAVLVAFGLWAWRHARSVARIEGRAWTRWASGAPMVLRRTWWALVGLSVLFGVVTAWLLLAATGPAALRPAALLRAGHDVLQALTAVVTLVLVRRLGTPAPSPPPGAP